MYSSANLLHHYAWNLELKYEDCPRLVYTNGCFFHYHLEYLALFLLKACSNLSKCVKERENTRKGQVFHNILMKNNELFKRKTWTIYFVDQSKMILLILYQLHIRTLSCREHFSMFEFCLHFTPCEKRGLSMRFID